MSKDEFSKWAIGCGWKQDSFGHLHKGGYRFKIQVNSVRLERSYECDGKKWVRLKTGYLSKLSIKDNKLCGMK